MNETDIISQLARKDQERLRGYRELLEFYQGRQWTGRERWGEKRLTFNYARSFIDKITSYLMSGVSFAVEAAEDTPEAREQAQQAEKALLRVYEENNLEQLDYETEMDCAILGDACYKVTWENEFEAASSRLKAGGGEKGRGRVRVTAPDIQGIYAWWRGDDVSRVWKVASKYQLEEEEVERLCPRPLPPNGAKPTPYPPSRAGIVPEGHPETPTGLPRLLARTGYGSSKLKTIVEVWTDRDFRLYLDNILLEKKPNPYGFIPFIIFPNLREPKKFWGTSDLLSVMEPQRELNRAMSQVSRILELSGNPVAVLENVDESTDIAVQPGAVWNIPEDAKAYLLDLLQGGGLQLHINYIDLLYRALHDISETPRAAFGGMGRDLSGVAMQIELYPLLQKILRKRTIRSAVYNRRNRMILELLEKFSAQRGQFSDASRYPATEDRLPNSGNFRLRTVWGKVLPQDRSQQIRDEQVLVREGIHSRRKAMDEVGIQDPEAEFRRWMEEQRGIEELEAQSLKLKA